MCVRISVRDAKSARKMKIWSFQILIRFTSFVINKERAGTPSTPLTRPSW